MFAYGLAIVGLVAGCTDAGPQADQIVDIGELTVLEPGQSNPEYCIETRPCFVANSVDGDIVTIGSIDNQGRTKVGKLIEYSSTHLIFTDLLVRDDEIFFRMPVTQEPSSPECVQMWLADERGGFSFEVLLVGSSQVDLICARLEKE